MGDVALSVMSLPETTPPGGGGGTCKARAADPAGRAFPRRPHDHFLLPLPLALAILPPLARDAGDYTDNATSRIPVPDIINILSMLSVVWLCVVVPLVSDQFGKESRTVLSVAFILLAFHPICMVGHYRLFSARGRHVYTERGEDFPYCRFRTEFLRTSVASEGWHVQWEAVPPGEQSDPP